MGVSTALQAGVLTVNRRGQNESTIMFMLIIIL